MSVIRILLVDSDPLYRECLAGLLNLEKDLLVVGDISPADPVVDVATRCRPALALIKLAGPAWAGLEIVRQLDAAEPEVVPILLADDAVEQALHGILLGARGIVNPSAGSRLLLKCIRGVAAGELWIRREWSSSVLDILRRPPAEDDRPRRGAESRIDRRRSYGLSPREFQIMNAVANGLVNKEIAATLEISEATVKHHLTRIFAKLNVHNRVELAMFSVRNQTLDC